MNWEQRWERGIVGWVGVGSKHSQAVSDWQRARQRTTVRAMVGWNIPGTCTGASDWLKWADAWPVNGTVNGSPSLASTQLICTERDAVVSLTIIYIVDINLLTASIDLAWLSDGLVLTTDHCLPQAPACCVVNDSEGDLHSPVYASYVPWDRVSFWAP